MSFDKKFEVSMAQWKGQGLGLSAAAPASQPAPGYTKFPDLSEQEQASLINERKKAMEEEELMGKVKVFWEKQEP